MASSRAKSIEYLREQVDILSDMWGYLDNKHIMAVNGMQKNVDTLSEKIIQIEKDVFMGIANGIKEDPNMQCLCSHEDLETYAQSHDLTQYLHGAHLVLTWGDRFLVIKEYGHDFFNFPGGKCEKGETFDDTLKRELKEEVDIDFTGTVSCIYSIYDGVFTHKEKTYAGAVAALYVYHGNSHEYNIFSRKIIGCIRVEYKFMSIFDAAKIDTHAGLVRQMAHVMLNRTVVHHSKHENFCAINVLQEYCQRRKWAVPSYTMTTEGLAQRVHVTIPGHPEYEGYAMDRNRRVAKNAAAIDLFKQLEPVPDYRHPDKNGSRFANLVFKYKRLFEQDSRASVSILQEFCQIMHIPNPKYIVSTNEFPPYTCTVVVAGRFDGMDINETVTCSGGSKVMAKRLTAESMLRNFFDDVVSPVDELNAISETC